MTLDVRQTEAARVWNRDATLWTDSGEDAWLGWLDAPGAAPLPPATLAKLRETIASEEIRHVVLLGMGGSSLCPDLFACTFERAPGAPALVVLDSTVPAQVQAATESVDLAHSLVVIASKSGGTIEPNSLLAHFREHVPADRVVAITDPGTALDRRARKEGFLATVHGDPEIGGRFSALSAFGMLPAALMGLDADDLLARARAMAEACGADVPEADNPALQLGRQLGEAAQRGRDKLTLVSSPAIESLGGWLEQLVAESTGKHGQGIVPVAGEQLGPPERYGNDRIFVHTRLAGSEDAETVAALAALERAGHPVVRIELADARDLAGEFFRWELVTAIAGAQLGINPFDQPDVEAAKVAARELMAGYEREGALPAPEPLVADGRLALYADPEAARRFAGQDPAELVASHLGRLGAGDYFAINAFVAMRPEHDAPLQALRHGVRDARRVATTLGYGPRFLHSTGQLHKGGPESGVFLEITADDAQDLPVPGQAYSFGVLAAAQAQGDFAVLCERGRRALRVHLGADVEAGLAHLARLVQDALA